jgi:hypothetical protein
MSTTSINTISEKKCSKPISPARLHTCPFVNLTRFVFSCPWKVAQEQHHQFLRPPDSMKSFEMNRYRSPRSIDEHISKRRTPTTKSDKRSAAVSIYLTYIIRGARDNCSLSNMRTITESNNHLTDPVANWQSASRAGASAVRLRRNGANRGWRLSVWRVRN